MACPNEIWEDLTPTVVSGKTVYTVRKPPYIAGTVSVWRNGMLQDADFHVETDPALGTITLCEDILDTEDEDHSLHVSYQTFEPAYVNPEAPVHVSRLFQGDVVRIAMKAGRHLEPVLMPREKQVKLLPGRASAGGRSLRAKNYSRTTFLGFITQNDSINGTLVLQVEDRGGRRKHLQAIVPYKDILVIRKFITPGDKGIDDVPIGGGGNAIRRPGVIAKGWERNHGFMKLVRVYF